MKKTFSDSFTDKKDVLKSQPEVTDDLKSSEQKVSDLKEAYDKWQQDGYAPKEERAGSDILDNEVETADKSTVDTGSDRSEKTTHEGSTQNG